MNLDTFDRLYREQVSGAGATGSVIQLQLDPVEPGKIRVITHLSVENETNSYTKVRIAIKHHSRLFYLDELLTPAAAELVVSRSDILLGEADILLAELTGTATADVLSLTALGTESKI